MRLLELTDRDGRLSVQIRHVAVRRWHATITAMRPNTGIVDDTIPIVDLGVFRSRKGATAAANLIVEHWAWNGDR